MTQLEERAPEGDQVLSPTVGVREGRWRYRLGSLALLAGLIGLWEILPRSGFVSEIIVPPFSEVAVALWTLIQTDFFLEHFTVTLREILVGFVLGTIIGFIAGVLLAISRPVNRITYPFVVAFQAIPKIVFAPLFIAWFGFGESSKIVMAMVISFFPVLINTKVGLENVPEDSIRLMRSLRATPIQVFRKVSLLHALPIIFAGVQTALTFAVIGALVGEFVGASSGMGYLLNLYNFQLRIDRVFSVIVILAAVGAVGYFLLEWLGKKLIYWREDEA
jgi:NitT/TauT family transport system permease protein